MPNLLSFPVQYFSWVEVGAKRRGREANPLAQADAVAAVREAYPMARQGPSWGRRAVVPSQAAIWGEP